MEEQSFVPALIELRHSETDTVVAQLHKLFAEISRMNPQQVTAAFQTVKCTAESAGLEDDVAVRHTLAACHQRMVALVHEADSASSNKLANTFCALLGIKVEYKHMADQYLAKRRM
jgi:hypothetical protein